MSTILYNTNSSLIPKYQRNNLLKSNKVRSRSSLTNNQAQDKLHTSNKDASSNNLPIFNSPHEKNSVKYLQQLCRSIYSESLHQRINQLKPSPDLQINAFVALIFQNFVKSWYGVKIPTDDDEFITELFNLLQNMIQYLANRINDGSIDWEALLADDIPVIISKHIHGIRECKLNLSNNETTYTKYCKLTLFEEDKYPYIITDFLKKTIGNTDSMLQSSMLDSLFNVLLLNHIMDSIVEPYYVLDGINKVCSKLKAKKMDKLKKKAAQYRNTTLSFISI